MSDEIGYHTPSPPALEDSSHDEYASTPPSKRVGMVWTMPSQRTTTSNIGDKAQKALEDLYEKLYGKDSIRCLLTGGGGGLQIAHVVKRASKSPEVSEGYGL
jgi:hypothetical protein